MAYLINKILLAVCFASVAVSQSQIPDESWSEFFELSCPEEFIQIGHYCVRCKDPLVFDPIDMKCGPCTEGRSFNYVSKRCDCQSKISREAIHEKSQSECPYDPRGTKKVYNQDEDRCECPADMPLQKGSLCIPCQAGTQWSPKERLCYHCSKGFVRDGNSRSCVPDL